MFEDQFIDRNGRTIDITVDEDDCHAEAFHNDSLIGHMDWSERSIGLDYQGEDIYGALLTHIYLDEIPGYTRCGIGTRIVELIRDYSGSEVLVRRDTGRTLDDGSHPTQDAPGFYHSLTKKGLAHWLD